jgi:hypothetical protein
MQTNVKVRVQAAGGKYLGPALDAAPPTLTINVPGQAPLGPLTFPTGSSGQVYPSKGPGTSPYPIVVQPFLGSPYQAGTYYLGPQTTPPLTTVDSYLIVPLELPAGQTTVTFQVQAFSPSPVSGSATATLTGGNDYTAEPGVVVQVGGLRVTEVVASGATITANVAMMCGCMITPNADTSVKEPYWPAYEFEVTAEFFGCGAPVLLQCTAPSTFQAPLPSGIPVGTSVRVVAVQPATGNRNEVRTTVVPAV